MDEETTTATEVAVLKRDVKSIGTLLDKYDKRFDQYDQAFDKMQEIASNLSQMLALQEQRLSSQDKTNTDIQTTLEVRRLEHNADVKELNARITSINHELTLKIEAEGSAILEEVKALREEISDKGGLGSKLKEIETWKWMVSGALLIGSWYVASAVDLKEIIEEIFK